MRHHGRPPDAGRKQLDAEGLRAAAERALNELTGTWGSVNAGASAAMTLTRIAYGPDSPQEKLAAKLAGGLTDRAELHATHFAVQGLLRNLIRDIEGGLLKSFRAQVAGEVLADLTGLAREVLAKYRDDDGTKVGSVLAAAAFEDTLRRMGSDLADVRGRPPLLDVAQQLRAAGLLQGAAFNTAQANLGFRNKALHAQWADVDRATTESVLSFVEGLL